MEGALQTEISCNIVVHLILSGALIIGTNKSDNVIVETVFSLLKYFLESRLQ